MGSVEGSVCGRGERVKCRGKWVWPWRVSVGSG